MKNKDKMKREKKDKHKKKKKEKKSKKESSRKRKQPSSPSNERTSPETSITTNPPSFINKSNVGGSRKTIPFSFQYICAPMVGASELPFRLLCRKYGTQLAYTPMISSTSFVNSPEYRATELQTIPQDRPLVVHFSANDPETFANAAKLVEDSCDAIDLNLGCPQRTAYVGHFGSYLLDDKDRQLIINIVKAGNAAVKIPIFVKIRLLNTLNETIRLCQQLRDAGASLIAIHARYRASFQRKGPGARDGPAHLDQVLQIKKVITDIPIISNGNVITYHDVQNNLDFTKADGIMSAEGILDNPALFLPRLGSKTEHKNVNVINIEADLPRKMSTNHEQNTQQFKKKRKLIKKMREIQKIEQKLLFTRDCSETEPEPMDEGQRKKLDSKAKIEQDLILLEKERVLYEQSNHSNVEYTISDNSQEASSSASPLTKSVPLQYLYELASNKVGLAKEYLNLTKIYTATMRTKIFHTRRICRDLLNQYQLMEECVSSKSSSDLERILSKIEKYQTNPESFVFDKEKEKMEQLALQKKRHEEGKRKAYEARMIRKAKREKKEDLEYYLRQGADVPSIKMIKHLQTLTKEKQLEEWKKGNHSQHCLAFHLGCCKRDRACAFLHVHAKGANAFLESEEVAG